MDKLTLADILEPKAYEPRRTAIRASIMEHKKARRVAVGPIVSLVFEDRQTLRFQVMEMCRAEQIAEPARIQGELDVYNELMPAEREITATMFIELTNEAELREWMPKLPGIEHHVALQVGAAKAPAAAEEGRSTDTVTSSVHYLRFPLTPAAIEAWRAGAPVRVVVDHGGYRADVTLSTEVRASLSKDLGMTG